MEARCRVVAKYFVKKYTYSKTMVNSWKVSSHNNIPPYSMIKKRWLGPKELLITSHKNENGMRG